MWNRSLALPDFLGQKTTPTQRSLAESTYVWHEAKLSLGGEEACVCKLRVPRTRGSPLQFSGLPWDKLCSFKSSILHLAERECSKELELLTQES